MSLNCSIVETLENIPATEWNAMADRNNPFIHYEFLYALEHNNCLHQWGWLPRYVTAHDENGKLVGAVPLYLKDNSYGEFVFDWAWADAYARHRLQYYPKLVAAVPYTPVTGCRLLAQNNSRDIKEQLVEAALRHAKKLGVSSLHWLFTDSVSTQIIKQQGFMLRTGYQFHWHNNGYNSFDDFLAALSSKKRKQIRRERKRVSDAGIEIELLDGHQAAGSHWKIFHDFYCSTFQRKSGYPTLTLEFFMQLGKSMPGNVLLILARHNGEYVAGAFNMRGENTLYGRHWGCNCNAQFDNLHFEVCYYAAIEYCIENRLLHFEAGAQGEHKLSRGFLPSRTYSLHWLAHPDFSKAIAAFLDQETRGIEHYMNELAEHSPYRQDND